MLLTVWSYCSNLYRNHVWLKIMFFRNCLSALQCQNTRHHEFINNALLKVSTKWNYLTTNIFFFQIFIFHIYCIKSHNIWQRNITPKKHEGEMPHLSVHYNLEDKILTSTFLIFYTPKLLSLWTIFLVFF